jgi:hypothetical protein
VLPNGFAARLLDAAATALEQAATTASTPAFPPAAEDAATAIRLCALVVGYDAALPVLLRVVLGPAGDADFTALPLPVLAGRAAVAAFVALDFSLALHHDYAAPFLGILGAFIAAGSRRRVGADPSLDVALLAAADAVLHRLEGPPAASSPAHATLLEDCRRIVVLQHAAGGGSALHADAASLTGSQRKQ